MIKKIFSLDSYFTSKEFDVENYCPYCGTANDPKKITDLYSYNEYLKPIVLILQTSCCHKFFMSLYILERGEPKLLYTYPTGTPTIFSDAIKEISPDFIKLHTQAKFSERNGHLELAATGYRNALEFLIKDFAIKILKKDPKEVSKKTLASVITSYLPNPRMEITADVVRILGNDSTHFERKHPDVEFSEIKRYLNIFIRQIELEYAIINPPVSRKLSQPLN